MVSKCCFSDATGQRAQESEMSHAAAWRESEHERGRAKNGSTTGNTRGALVRSRSLPAVLRVSVDEIISNVVALQNSMDLFRASQTRRQRRALADDENTAVYFMKAKTINPVAFPVRQATEQSDFSMRSTLAPPVVGDFDDKRSLMPPPPVPSLSRGSSLPSVSTDTFVCHGCRRVVEQRDCAYNDGGWVCPCGTCGDARVGMASFEESTTQNVDPLQSLHHSFPKSANEARSFALNAVRGAERNNKTEVRDAIASADRSRGGGSPTHMAAIRQGFRSGSYRPGAAESVRQAQFIVDCDVADRKTKEMKGACPRLNRLLYSIQSQLERAFKKLYTGVTADIRTAASARVAELMRRAQNHAAVCWHDRDDRCCRFRGLFLTHARIIAYVCLLSVIEMQIDMTGCGGGDDDDVMSGGGSSSSSSWATLGQQQTHQRSSLASSEQSTATLRTDVQLLLSRDEQRAYTCQCMIERIFGMTPDTLSVACATEACLPRRRSRASAMDDEETGEEAASVGYDDDDDDFEEVPCGEAAVTSSIASCSEVQDSADDEAVAELTNTPWKPSTQPETSSCSSTVQSSSASSPSLSSNRKERIGSPGLTINALSAAINPSSNDKWMFHPLSPCGALRDCDGSSSESSTCSPRLGRTSTGMRGVAAVCTDSDVPISTRMRINHILAHERFLELLVTSGLQQAHTKEAIVYALQRVFRNDGCFALASDAMSISSRSPVGMSKRTRCTAPTSDTMLSEAAQMEEEAFVHMAEALHVLVLRAKRSCV